MEQAHVDWKRFWYPSEATIRLSDRGYLPDPDMRWGALAYPELSTFDQLATLPCVVLLGEPGSGKTTALEAAFQQSSGVDAAGDAALWIKLQTLASAERLERAILTASKTAAWRAGAHRLHLFLDGLDEALLRIDTVTDLLIEIFTQLPRERLLLRLACRASDWPVGFGEELHELWGDGARTYHLAPLRRSDVHLAAKVRQLDGDAFLAEIERVNAVPLAIKPITLNLLLALYERQKSLPATQQDVYARGCRLLCEETNQHRRDTRRIGVNSATERQEAAAYLAAITVFSNRYGIWTAPDTGQVPDVDVTLDDVLMAATSAGLQVSPTALAEALATPLFTSHGGAERTWAHQTYAEYLAARFAVTRFSQRQLHDILFGADHKLVPQLRTVAAWIATLSPELFPLIAEADPEAALRADVAATNPANRAHLVATLLEFYERNNVFDSDTALWRRYSALCHPTLAEQLTPYLTDSTKGVIARRVAVRIARACSLQNLQAQLLDIALDPSEEPYFRGLAAEAVGTVGDAAAKQALRSLAFGDAGEDPDDEMKGDALRVLWPTYLTAEELFRVLTPPQNEHLFGSYMGFLTRGFEHSLRREDMGVALRWAEQHASLDGRSRFKPVVDALLQRAATLLEEDAIVEAFARVALVRLSSHQPLVETTVPSESGTRSPLFTDERTRHRVLNALLRHLAARGLHPAVLVYPDASLVSKHDVPWLLERVGQEADAAISTTMMQLIEQVTDLWDPEQLDLIVQASSDIPAIAEHFRRLIAPVALDSEEAKLLRARYQEEQKLSAAQRAQRPAPPPSPNLAALISNALTASETGDVAAWWHLDFFLSAAPDTGRILHEFHTDITKLPAWQQCESETQARIVGAARRYLQEFIPDDVSWFTARAVWRWTGKSISLYRPVFAGYRALMLLSQIDSAALQTIGSDVWQRWAPIIVTFPATLEVEDKKQHDTLVRVAYFHAARTMIAAFLIQCRQCNRDFGNVRSLERVDVCWDERFASAAYNLVRWGQLQAAALETLLGNLLLHGSVPARALAQHWIDERSNDSATYGRSVLAAATLLNHAADAGWSIVWPAFQDDKAFGRDVLLHLHGASTGDMPIAPRLLDDQLADLFDYVRILFPPEDDPELPSGFVTPEQRIALWRSALVSHLVQRRTTTAHQALHRLVQTYPQDLWLRTQLSEAADALRHDAWQPPSPLVLCKLAASHDTRLVENGEQLLDVLAESLVRLATALQGETPAGQFLWDVHSEAGRKSYRPKDESALSDYIKLHLENDLRGRGIIANREVEIRKPVGDTQGERTDIQVDAIVRGPRATEFTPVTVIVEVKGCWNRDVRHAMDTQLTQRYLKDNQCRHGLYVVGWFICPQWISSDHRKRRTPWKSMTVAQEELKAQVQTLNHRPDLDVVVQCFVLDASLRV